MDFLLLVTVFAGTALLVLVLNHLASIPWRRMAGEHWTERARVLWPVRATAMTQIFMLPMIAVSLAVILHPVSTALLPVAFFAAWCGAVLGTWPLDRAMFPMLTFRTWSHDVAVAWLLRFGIWFVWLAVALLMPLEPGWEMAALLVGMVLLQFSWGRVATQVLRFAGVLTRPDGRLSRIVTESSARAGVPVRAVWVAGGCSVNAFAFPLTGDLVFTRRLLDELDDAEVASVCAHEIGHLGEVHAVKLARFAGSLTILPLLLIRPATETAGFPGIVAVGVAVLLLRRLAIRTSQSMEKRADGIAALAEDAPGVYARALEKIYRGNLLPAVMPGTRMPHPHLYQRMLDAGVQPDFPRPLPPSRRCWHAWLMIVLLPLLAMWAAHAHLEREPVARVPKTLRR